MGARCRPIPYVLERGIAVIFPDMMTLVKNALRPIYAPLLNTWHDFWRGARRYGYLYKEIRATKARRILEIGTWNGDRAVKMIGVASESAQPGVVEYYGFDLFEELERARFESEISKWPPTMREVEEKLRATGVHVRLFKGDTLSSLPAAVLTLPKMDFIYIDGGHSLETIQNDWEGASKLMHDKTVVLFDDYWQNNTEAGAKPIVDAIDKTLYDVRILPVIDHFTNPEFGPLSIQFARVAKKA